MLALEDFRSYAQVELPLARGATAFVGPNGAGKTNLLEAIHLIARGDSPRARDDTEMVRWGATTARVRTEVDRAEDHRRVETLLFAPPEGERRREMRELQHVLEQRNALLRVARDELELPEEEMAFWDRELVRLSAAISLRRWRLVNELSAPFVSATELFTGAEGLVLRYAGQVEGATLEERATAYQIVLREKRDRERWQGASLVGPQRDDLVVTSAGRMLPAFASRGEHRSAVLSLKIAEAAWLASRVGEQPVFLLDDVLSELDPTRREALARAIPEDAQTLLTAAIPTALPDILRERATLVPVRRGEVG